MKQLILRSGRAEVIDVPDPQVAPGSVLVRVAHSLVSSGTERSNLRSTGESLLAKAKRRPELVAQTVASFRRDGFQATAERIRGKVEGAVATGYSCSGTVMKVGRGVEDIEVGQIVACAGSRYAWHAELVVVPRNLIVSLDPGVGTRAGASVTVGAIALQGVRQAQVELGEWVVVSGLGLVGLLTVQLLRANGARVIGVDPIESRRQLALRLGAERVHGPDEAEHAVPLDTGGLGADRVIVTADTPSDAPLNQAMRIARKRGTVVIVGDVGLSVRRTPFYEKEIDVRISCSYGPGRYDATYEEEGRDYPFAYVRWTENRNMQAYAHLLREGRVDWQTLVSEEVALGDAPAAIARLAEPGAPLAIMVRYDAETPPQRSIVRASVPRSALPHRVRLGVIGAGSFLKSVHLPALLDAKDHFQVVGVATRTSLNASEVAKRLDARFCSTDPSAVIESDEVDAVVIATRHDQHAVLATAALRAGKAVFVEKPLALDNGELDEVLDAAAAASRPLFVGFNRRFSAACALMRERVARRGSAPIITYRVNADPGGDGDWTHGPEGGGRAVGEACHMIDFFHAVADSPLEDLQASPAGSGPADANFSVLCRFANGTLATLTYTTLGSRELPKEHIECFVGGEVVVVEDFRRARVLGSALRSWRTYACDKGIRQEWAAFHAACLGGPPPISLDTLRSVSEGTFRIRELTRGF